MAEDFDDSLAVQTPSFSTERARKLWEDLFADALSVQEVSEVLGVDKSTVMRWLRENELPGVRIGRSWRVREQDLRAYIHDQLVGQQEAVLETDAARLCAKLRAAYPRLGYRVLPCPNCGYDTLLVREFSHQTGNGAASVRLEGSCRNCNHQARLDPEDLLP